MYKGFGYVIIAGLFINCSKIESTRQLTMGMQWENIGYLDKDNDFTDNGKQAIFHYNNSLKINPNNVLALEKRGHLKIFAGKKSEAEIDLDKCLKLDSLNSETLILMSQLKFASGDYKACIPLAFKAMMLDSNEKENTNVKYSFGYINLAKGLQAISHAELGEYPSALLFLDNIEEPYSTVFKILKIGKYFDDIKIKKIEMRFLSGEFENSIFYPAKSKSYISEETQMVHTYFKTLSKYMNGREVKTEMEAMKSFVTLGISSSYKPKYVHDNISQFKLTHKQVQHLQEMYEDL